MQLKEIVLPPLFAKILTEPSGSMFTPQQRDEAHEFMELNHLGMLVSIHYMTYGKVIGKFTESLDVPSPYSGTQFYHVIQLNDIDEYPVMVEVPIHIQDLPEKEVDYISNRVGDMDTEGSGDTTGPNGEEFEYKWWIDHDKPEETKIPAYIIQNEALIADFEQKGLVSYDNIDCSEGALFFHTFDNKTELKIYEMAWKDAANPCDFKILCHLPGYTPMSFYTNKWWDGLTPEQRAGILNHSEPSSTNPLWFRLGEELQIRLFNIIDKDYGKGGPCLHTINEVCYDIACIKVLEEYDVPAEDMKDDQGKLLPFYKSKIDGYTDNLEDNLMQYLNVII